jgi:hypothetical protein
MQYNCSILNNGGAGACDTEHRLINQEGNIFMVTNCDSTTLQRRREADLKNKRARLSEPFYWNEEIEKATGNAFDWRCPFCNSDLHQSGFHKAHIHPVGSGIGVIPGNIVLSCPRCNESMHNTPAWLYCHRNGIRYAWIQLTLEVLAKVFACPPKVMPITFKTASGQEQVKRWLDENQAAADWTSKQIAENAGVRSPQTANEARKAWKLEVERGERPWQRVVVQP